MKNVRYLKKMKKNYGTEKGITLIALIITIVVMLILVAVSVNLVINGKLLDIAGNAVKKTNEKVVQQQNSVNELMEELEQVENIIIGAYIEGYDPNVAENGSKITTSYTSKGVEGDGTIAGGASGNGYKDQTFTVSSITKWRILGEENGQIIITPADPILVDGETEYSLRGQAGYVNCIDELNKISSIYGQGKYADTSKYSVNLGTETIASGGRNIKLEDLECTIDTTPTKKTYTKNADDGYIYDDGEKSTYTSFTYWGEDAEPSEGAEWKTLESGESVTIKSYGFKSRTRTTLQEEMILKKSDSTTKATYWLASRCIGRNTGTVGFSTYLVNNGFEGNFAVMYSSKGDGNLGYLAGIRPVVYLKSNVKLEYNSTTEVYTIKGYK